MEEMTVSCRGFSRRKSLFLESKTNRRAVAHATFPIEKKSSYPVLLSLITPRELQRSGAISLADQRTANGSPLSECPQDQKGNKHSLPSFLLLTQEKIKMAI